MSLHYRDEQITLHHGDALDVARTLPDNSVDCVITSPPYALQRASTYGGIEEADYPEWTVTWMHAIARLLKPNGSVALNISPHVRDGQLADYVMRMRLAVRDSGWFEHDELIWVKPDKMPTGKPTWPVRAWESIYWYSLTSDPYCDAKANGNLISDEARAKAARRGASAFRGRDQRMNWDHLPGGSRKMTATHSRAKNWVSIAVATVGADADHPAPYPPRLAQWLVQFFCPPGGTVLDPFSGSGTTGLAAQRLGRRYIGIDINAAYLNLSLRTRLRQSALDFEEGA